LVYVQVKRITKGFEDERILNDVIHEVRMLTKLKHDRIAQHLAWYQTPRHVWVVSEFCAGGSLRDVLIHHPLETECVKDLIRDTCAGLRYLHTVCGIVHGDLRPESIVLTENGVAKLAGFTMAHYFSADTNISSSSTTYKPATTRLIEHVQQFAEYSAPEVLKACAASTRIEVETTIYSDVWTLGITLYECIVGSPPFTGTSFFHLFERIVDDEPVYFREGTMREFSLAPLVKSLLRKDPLKRIVNDALLSAVTALD
jgi:serine/threonine protein kinase